MDKPRERDGAVLLIKVFGLAIGGGGLIVAMFTLPEHENLPAVILLLLANLVVSLATLAVTGEQQ